MTFLVILIGIVAVVSVVNRRWRRSLKTILDWHETNYASWQTKPRLESLRETYTIPGPFFRAQAMVSFWAVMVFSLGFIVLRFVFPLYAELLLLPFLILDMVWVVRFLMAYQYVNECARREAERWARENSTSSRE